MKFWWTRSLACCMLAGMALPNLFAGGPPAVAPATTAPVVVVPLPLPPAATAPAPVVVPPVDTPATTAPVVVVPLPLPPATAPAAPAAPAEAGPGGMEPLTTVTVPEAAPVAPLAPEKAVTATEKPAVTEKPLAPLAPLAPAKHPATTPGGLLAEKEAAAPKLSITSSAFKPGGLIPPRFTCEGGNNSPPLNFGSYPEGTKSLVLIVEDLDAPRGPFDHWLVFNIPPTSNVVEAGLVPPGGKQGKNGWGHPYYEGPCPDFGQHRYSFKLFALSRMIKLDPGASKAELYGAMKDLVLEKAVLTGVYKKTK